jgi:dienelactone hydrolase
MPGVSAMTYGQRLDQTEATSHGSTTVVRIPTVGVLIEAEVAVPERPAGLVMIAPGVAGARRRPHLRATLLRLADAGWVTALVELLTPQEERLDDVALHRRLDLGLLAGRTVGVLDWLLDQRVLSGLSVGLLGAGRGAAVALLTASRRPDAVGAVVSRGLRLGLGGDTLSQVTAPTLLIAAEPGAQDRGVVGQTAQRLGGRTELRVVPDGDRGFLEPGPLDQVLQLSRDWFTRYLSPGPGRPPRG